MLDEKMIEDILSLMRSKLEFANKMNWNVQVDQGPFYDGGNDVEEYTVLGSSQIIGEKVTFHFGVTDKKP